MRITALGQCGFLLEAHGARIVTDPHFSDCLSRVSTDDCRWERLYAPPISLRSLAPDLILISHAHLDHLDPDTLRPYFAEYPNAQIAVPAPEVPAAEALGAKNVISARAEEPFSVGSARITPVACAHTQLHTDDLGRFYELSYGISFGDGESVFFGGDMSLYDGLERRIAALRPSVLLLPANGRDKTRAALGIVGNLTPDEAAALSSRLSIPWIPMHHDLYAVNRCPPGTPEQASLRVGAVCRPLRCGESAEY